MIRNRQTSMGRIDVAQDHVAALGRLLVTASFSTKGKKEKAVKTERPRQVPVHKCLAAMLAEWKLGGWQAMLGRAPDTDDLIIPSREGRFRGANHALKKFHQDLLRLEMRARRLHDLRRSFVTLARSDGARSDILEWVTHGPRGDIINVYTSLPWELLCGEVEKLQIELHKGHVIALPKVAISHGGDDDLLHSVPTLAGTL